MNKTYLITGTSRGIGLGLVSDLLCDYPSSHIIATARNLSTSTKLKELKDKFPDRLTLLELDVTSTASVQNCAKIVADKFPNGIDYLINNGATRGSSDKCTEATLQETYDVNVIGVMRVVQAFLPLVNQSTSKSVLAISSLAGAFPNVAAVSQFISISGMERTDLYPYRASKSALNYIFACLAEDYKKDGIIFVPLHPGQVDTDMNIGENPISISECTGGLLKVIHNLKLEDSGKFLDYNGLAHSF